MIKKALAPSNPVTTRDRKGRKFISVVENAYNKAGLSEGEAQKVNDTPGLADIVGNFIAENRLSNRFKDEEVKSNYGYLSGYKPKDEDLDRQIAILQDLSPGLGSPNLDYLQKVKSGTVKTPKHSEKFFAVVNIWKDNHPIGFGATYSEALKKVLSTIKQTRNFYNYREGQIDEKHIRQSAHTQKFFQDLSEAQGDPDILIVPAQFGIRHRGRSVRRAREVFLSNEFGLGAFAAGIMILTHPERLQHYDDLWIDCAGDEWSFGAGGVFDRAPLFGFDDDGVEFVTAEVDHAGERFGSASGFFDVPLPQ